MTPPFYSIPLKTKNLWAAQMTKWGTLEGCIETLSKNYPSPPTVVLMDQVHSSTATRFEAEGTDRFSAVSPIQLPSTDAVWTTEPNTLIAVRTADCLPLLIAHESGLIGGVHAGRKGTENFIVQKTLSQICDFLGLKTGFELVVGPFICKNCYQIDPIHDLHYDLWTENQKQWNAVLQDPTLLRLEFCTACNHDQFFSYRKGDACDRQYSFIGKV